MFAVNYFGKAIQMLCYIYQKPLLANRKPLVCTKVTKMIEIFLILFQEFFSEFFAESPKPKRKLLPASEL
jgi:hypothetical protein